MDIDTRSDIYSLGVLLYELLTGTTPFSEEELRKAGYIEMQRVIREQEPARPSVRLTTLGETLTDIAKRRSSTPDLLGRAVRGDLDWIVMKSLEKDRLRRYEAAESLAMDIQRHLEHRPVSARAPSTGYRLRKFVRRNRLQAMGALIVVVMVGTIVILSVWNRYQIRLAEAEGVRQVNVLSEARKLIAKGELTAARKTLRPILDSRLAGGLEARILFANTLAPGQEPDESVKGTEAIMERHYRERVRYYSQKIQADPADPDNYLQRAQQYDCLHEERNVHADMSRYGALVTHGRFPAIQFGTPKNLASVIKSASRYQLVLSVAGRENGIVLMSIAFRQKGRSTMKPFEIPMFFASLFGACLFASFDAPVVLADLTFGTPTNLATTVPALDPMHDYIDCFSFDGLEMYIESDKPGGLGGADLWVSRRASPSAPWRALENLGSPVNRGSNQFYSSISADGLTLYFTSDQLGGYGTEDIYMTKRTSKTARWGQPENLGPKINSAAYDDSPWTTADGLELYFTSTRTGGYAYRDIYVARRASPNDAWGEPVNLGPPVNSVYGENLSSVSADGLLLLFNDRMTGTPRPGGYGKKDMWMARRASRSEPWQTPVNLGPQVNASANDFAPRISPDGRTLYFWSERGGSVTTWQAAIIPVVDFDGDGKVDMGDLAMLSDNWGRSETLCDVGPYAWGDGIVDAQDLAVLAEYMDVKGPVVAHSPVSRGLEVPRDVILSWTPGDFAQTHDVYFGTSLENVTSADRAEPLGVLVSPGQDVNTYDPPGLLEWGRTYYWRIDEVGAKTYRGFVWTFTTESLSYPIKNVTATASSAVPGAGAESTVNGSGLDANDLHSAKSEDMWLSAADGPKPAWIQFEFDKLYKLDQMLVWNYNVMFEHALGYGVKDVVVEHSVDGAVWTTLGTYRFERSISQAGYAYNTTIDFGGVPARFVTLTIQSNWGGLTPAQYGLSEVRFLYVPAQATEPQPADGANGVSPDSGLSWTPGRGAAVHEVYLSTDREPVAAGTALVDRVTQSSYEPGPLNLGQKYYWKINEVNETETPSVWEGDLWSFSTQEYIVVDDFESYTNDSPNRVFQTWIDGMGFSADASFPNGIIPLAKQGQFPL